MLPAVWTGEGDVSLTGKSSVPILLPFSDVPFLQRSSIGVMRLSQSYRRRLCPPRVAGSPFLLPPRSLLSPSPFSNNSSPRSARVIPSDLLFLCSVVLFILPLWGRPPVITSACLRVPMLELAAMYLGFVLKNIDVLLHPLATEPKMCLSPA